MSHTALDQVAVVLFEPLNPVNIAGTLRAMKNMGVSRLRLVRPVEYDAYNLEGIAHGTGDLIAAIETYDSFDDAVRDCVYVAGFTARRRAAKWRIIDPKAAAGELLARIYARELEGDGEGEGDGEADAEKAGAMVAMVFGREDNGLPNEILDRVHVVVTIPTTDHASLNLAQAVLIGLYELHLGAGNATRTLAPPRKSTPPPTGAAYELFFADAERALDGVEFFKTRHVDTIMRNVRALAFRAGPDARELSLVRAMVIEVVRFMRRTGRT